MALGSASAKVVQVTLREAEAKLVSAQWDDGADENIIPADLFRRLFPRLALRSSGPHIGHINGLGGAVRPLGLADLVVQYGSRQFIDYFTVVPASVPVLLGNRNRPRRWGWC
jgi:ABC-type methionine transport system permease subunit